MKLSEEGLTSNIVKFFSEEQQKELIARFEMEAGDLIFMIADEKSRANQALDHLRRRLSRDRDLIRPDQYEFLWVVDFPLFSYDNEEGVCSASTIRSLRRMPMISPYSVLSL